jgi:hypothetical protein
MNRSIFQIRKQNTSLETRLIYKCSFINKFKGVFSIDLNRLNDLQVKSSGRKVFKEFKKQVEHAQVEFENIGSESNNFYKTFLSCNTTKPNKGFYEHIGKIKHKGEIKDQFINFKHQLTFDKSSSPIIEYNNISNILNKTNEIDVLLKQSNKIPILEEKLNFIQNSFENCVKHSHKISDCYHILSINSYKISNGLFDTILTYNLL